MARYDYSKRRVGRPYKGTITKRVHFLMEMKLYCELWDMIGKRGTTCTSLLHKYIREGIERDKMVQIRPRDGDITYTKWFTEHKDDDTGDLR